jgi:phosphatidylglycerol:prolipoprotein diacylglycerol transferase
MLAQSIVHSADPFLVQFSPTLGIRWYGVAYLAGFVAAWLMIHWLAKRKVIPLAPAQVGDFMTACVLGVVVGGRLGHVLLYDPHLLWSFHSDFPFWGLLELHRGGMSSHGGMVGVFLAMLWLSRKFFIQFLALCDVVCLGAAPGLMFGRLANWVNGELWGRVLPESMQATPPVWSVKFPEEALVLSTPDTRAHVEHLYTMTYAGSAEAAAKIALLVPARFPSQFLQAFTDGPVLIAVMAIVWLRPRPPGTLFATFLMAYGALRMVTEQFRDADAGVFTIGMFTLPMLLSLGMVAAGAVLAFVVAGRPPAQRVGGLLTGLRA